MCKFKILSITYKTIILRKPIYLNKLLNEELMRNTRLKYSNLFLVPNISDENWEKIVRLGCPLHVEFSSQVTTTYKESQ